MRKDESEINKVYDSSADKYYEKRYEGTIHNTFIANPAIRTLLKNVKGKRLLDIGCGFGEDLKYFSNKGAKVVGVELNKKLIKIAKQDPELEKVVILQGSIYHLNLKEKFDICLANLVLDQVQNLREAFSNVNRALKKNGEFIFSVAHPLNCATRNYSKELSDYFTPRKSFFYPKSIGKVPFYYRNFDEYSKIIDDSGFLIKRILEPKPLKEAKKFFNRDYNLFNKLPDILIMSLVKHKSSK